MADFQAETCGQTEEQLQIKVCVRPEREKLHEASGGFSPQDFTVFLRKKHKDPKNEVQREIFDPRKGSGPLTPPGAFWAGLVALRHDS